MAVNPGELPPGATLFGHTIKRTLGRGGMGTVYLAEQQSLKREVALKVLHPQRVSSQAQVDSFLREARAAGALNHPHLLVVHGVHADPDLGLYCYAMEYVPGLTLSAAIQRQGVLSGSQALHVTQQVARALGYAHRHGLVHRDVKPDNILISPQGQAKLADLGLVRDRLEGMSASSGRVLSLVGTPDYSAPEQCRNPGRASPSSDCYSLGACLYFMLLGRPPFRGETVIDLIVRAATEDPELPDSLPANCRALLARLLARDPLARFPDGDAVAEAITGLAQGRAIEVPATDEEDGRDERTAAPAIRPRRRRR